MGARPSTYKKGGGFLNDVDGVIIGYQFTDEFNGEAFVPGINPKTKKAKFHSLNMVLSVRVDGAEEDTTTTLFGGDYDKYDVSEDGYTLTSVDGGECSIGANTAIAKFYASLVAAGYPETNFSEDPDSINFEPANGTRVRFTQRLDESMKGKKRKGKDGKEYDYKDLVVGELYALASGKPAKAPVKGKPVIVAKGKPAKAAEAEVDVDRLAKDTLVQIIAAANGTIPIKKVSMQVLKLLMKHDNREDVRKLLSDSDFLHAGAEEKLWQMNGDLLLAA